MHHLSSGQLALSWVRSLQIVQESALELATTTYHCQVISTGKSSRKKGEGCLCDLCYTVPEKNFKSCCNCLAGEEMFTVVLSRKVQRNSALIWLQHHLLPWIWSGLEHLTCADGPKENWKLLLPLSRDESPLSLWGCSLSWHFWVGDGCWIVTCETISRF